MHGIISATKQQPSCVLTLGCVSPVASTILLMVCGLGGSRRPETRVYEVALVLKTDIAFQNDLGNVVQ
jgi:hypothetical protein